VCINVQNPDAPQIVATVATPTMAQKVSVSGDCACVAIGIGGIAVVNITNPRQPFVTGVLPVPENSRRLQMPGNGYA
jgi:hypothetical protein